MAMAAWDCGVVVRITDEGRIVWCRESATEAPRLGRLLRWRKDQCTIQLGRGYATSVLRTKCHVAVPQDEAAVLWRAKVGQ